ncbi:MAG: hypothetical protein Q7S65_06150, partial [Nanoarchaeota archaeon]|nr:hypothetical protein [Nanoarchaeota archaeon]
MDIRKILIIFVVGILFSVLVFAVIGAVYPQPKYEEACASFRAGPVKSGYEPTPSTTCPKLEASAQENKACQDKHGQ